MLRKAREDRATLVGRLYAAHGAALYRYARMLLVDGGAAEDAVQQVFAAVLRHRGELENELHYLRRSVRNECYSMLRKRQVRAAAAHLALEPAVPVGVSAEERMLLERAIAALPPDQREVIHLHVFAGMTFREVAAATEEPANTVASRYRYAIAGLRRMMTGSAQGKADE